MTREDRGDCIRLRSSIDQESTVHWYLNGRFLATSEPEIPVLLDLKHGQHRLFCMTTEGAMAQVRFQVQDPAASVNFRDQP